MSRESAESATELTEAPDYAAPLHAYRLWAVEEVAGSALAREGAMPPDRSLVIGTVSLWGSVVECERGWRAAFAYPDRLFAPWRCSAAEKAAVDLEAYGVTVELLEVQNVNVALDAVAELTA